MNHQYFLQLQGIQGDSADAAHRGWFQFDSMHVSAANSAAIGGRSQNGASPYSEISLTMAMGSASSKLFAAAKQHQRIPTGQIAVVDGSKTTQYNLQDIMISSTATASAGKSAHPSIHLSLHCRLQSGLHAAQMSHAMQASHALPRR